MAFPLVEGTFDALIFDCDGTLVDSAPAHLNSIQQALANLRGTASQLEMSSTKLNGAADAVTAESRTAESRVNAASQNVTSAATSETTTATAGFARSRIS